MTAIRIHDTMARKKRLFEPADPKRVTMYVCGPTVYNRAHIGNARPAVIFDVLSRLLRHVYGETSLVYARNVTDVDDKIIDAARAASVDPAVITRQFEQHYLDDMGALGVRRPDLAPHATETIPQMIAMIERLLSSGHAYEADGHVLFHVPSDPDYGALGRRDREAMIAGARVEVASYKKDPADFVLWKPSDADIIGWDSPWGRGRPGWHIECSAMIEQHLGQTIDIHGGGLDLIFPHHENEIAQSRCAHGGAPLARYWMHNGFLTMAGSEKMSKSLGNVVTVAELVEQGHRGETLRLALMSAHYRQPLEWSSQLIAQSKATLDRWYRLLGDIGSEGAREIGPFWEALCDDLNTPKAIAVINEFLRSSEQPLTEEHEFFLGGREQMLQSAAAAVRALGLLTMTKEQWFQGKGDERIEALIAERATAKQRRDYAEADRIRAELAAEGVLLEDSSSGTTWRRA
jgi:cysteinyl-tRNA synthetase